MVSKKAVILGYDAVSPLGTDLNRQWQRAVAGDCGIGKLSRFPLTADFPLRVAGEVAEVDFRPYGFFQPREMAYWTSPIFKYALLVVHRALEKSGISITRDIASRVAVTFSTAVGGLDAVLQADRRMIAEGKLPHPFTNPIPVLIWWAVRFLSLPEPRVQSVRPLRRAQPELPRSLSARCCCKGTWRTW